MSPLRPPNPRDPFVVAFLVVVAFVFGAVAYLAVHAHGSAGYP